MRTLLAPAQAVLGNRLALAQLVELSLTVTVYVATCRDDIVWGGNTYIGGRQTAIDAIADQGGEVQALKFQLDGVSNDTLAIALAEPVQGKHCRVYTALMDPDTLALLDVVQSWSGALDVMSITQGVSTSTITVTAEHRGIAFARPKGRRYSDADQQAMFPGDTSLSHIIAQATHADIWPAASWFRK